VTRIALALSPHLDDAVFSCGGTLALLSAAGWQVVVATLFTRSVPSPAGFALACQLDKGLDAGTDYMALRRVEDDRACALLGATPRWMPLAEAPHRGYNSAAALFGPLLATDPAPAELSLAIGTLLDDVAPDLLLAPQAIGGHVDHVQTARSLLARTSLPPVLWWRDFPYVLRDADRPPLARALQGASTLDVEVPPEPKGAACASYRSQLGFQFGGRDGLARRLAELHGTERFLCARPADLPPAIRPRSLQASHS